MDKQKSPGYESLIYKPTKVSWAIHTIVSKKEGQLNRSFFYFLLFSILSFIFYGFIAEKAIVVDTDGTIINSSSPQPVSSELSIKVGNIITKDNQKVKKGDVIFISSGYLEPQELDLVSKKINSILTNININKTSNFSKLIEVEQVKRSCIVCLFPIF
jgi:multidrug efflux pump subunit AcrA (membrane-fusion protein)